MTSRAYETWLQEQRKSIPRWEKLLEIMLYVVSTLLILIYV